MLTITPPMRFVGGKIIVLYLVFILCYRNMRLILLGLLFLVLAVRANKPRGANLEDNEFAEFEDLDEGKYS